MSQPASRLDPVPSRYSFQSVAVTDEERAQELAEIEQMERGIRSACSWDDCLRQSISGSRYCMAHLIEALRPMRTGNKE